MPETPTERRLKASLASYTSWANTENRTARTAPARAALNAKWLAEANGDPQRAEAARKAYYTGLALRSAQARRKAAEAHQTAPEATDAELPTAAGGGGDAA